MDNQPSGILVSVCEDSTNYRSKILEKKFQKVPNKENLDLLHIPAIIYMKFMMTVDHWTTKGLGGTAPHFPEKIHI